MKFLVILDRDGTLIVEKNYLSDPGQVEILPGVIQGLRTLVQHGAVLAIASNQSGIGRGYYSAEQAVAVNEKVRSLLAEKSVELGPVYFCPHTPEEPCQCRKPGIEMLQNALEETGIEPENAFMIGDKICDIEAGKAAGMRSILVRTGYGNTINVNEISVDFVAEDLVSAANWVIEKIKNPG